MINRAIQWYYLHKPEFMIRLIQIVWISISRTTQKKLFIMLQQSARISRCREHIWHGCTMLFVKILAFDQHVGNVNRCTTVPTRRRLLSTWLMSKHASVRFETVWLISSLLMDLRVECTLRGKCVIFHTERWHTPNTTNINSEHH